MKPAWDRLMKEYESSQQAIIADVDCTTVKGKQLCVDKDVKAYPTMKWGSPNALVKYDGGRDFDELQQFALLNLKGICGPASLALCSDAEKVQIQELLEIPAEELAKRIAKGEKLIEEAEELFEQKEEALQKEYEQLEKVRDATIKEIMDSGLALARKLAGRGEETDEEFEARINQGGAEETDEEFEARINRVEDDDEEDINDPMNEDL
eukprot:gnl/MRDRNA2_/MRDRNA2_108039_c0_seq1.p1 gnl/MRDRNA2_/MRDRNA2_108039_c0~~gnl/MRDRNA2_/MRDRNA2_108039_c0_seq1.p1  ORF type:complete len:209 (+),score=73.93 gnl/MRDRNA2_/MRDRNA2_108039_c0_seq1:241-867(+)